MFQAQGGSKCVLESYMLPGLEQEASQNIALWSRVNPKMYIMGAFTIKEEREKVWEMY